MKRKAWKALAALLLVLTMTVMGSAAALACTTLYVGANLTEEGTTFVARTEDYGANMNKLWFISETGHFKAGETYTGCPAYGAFEWTFTHDSYRFTYFTNDVFHGTCPECGEEDPDHWSYTEFGTNEMGVSVSATETISGSWAVKAVDPNVQTKTDGVVGIEETDIPTILLAEAASAREGIELLADIYDTYGAYGDSGLFVCDKDEVWYIENCSGTQYIALRLNDDLIFTDPNISVIGLIDLDDENVIASPRLVAVAQEAGTFVGDAAENIIDFRASYAMLGSEASPMVGAPRMTDALRYLDASCSVTEAELYSDNSLFTLSNLRDGEIVPVYSNIQTDRVLDKNDVFGFYRLSSVGKPSNQEIEIFQLLPENDTETGTVGWVGLGNMSYNVFVPYYPLLLEDIYDGCQVSTETVERVPVSEGRPDAFCTYGADWFSGDGYYIVYPENWRDSYYFAFEGLGGYIQDAESIDGAPVSDELLQDAAVRLDALQQAFNEEFAVMDPQDTTAAGMDMAARAHALALELIDGITAAAPDRGSASE